MVAFTGLQDLGHWKRESPSRGGSLGGLFCAVGKRVLAGGELGEEWPGLELSDCGGCTGWRSVPALCLMSWRLLYGDELTVQGVAASGGDLGHVMVLYVADVGTVT